MRTKSIPGRSLSSLVSSLFLAAHLTGAGVADAQTPAEQGAKPDEAPAAPASVAIDPGTISLKTASFTLIFRVGSNGRLYQIPVGSTEIPKKFDPSDEAYPQAGDGYIWEPALQVVHSDGNTSTDLKFAGVERLDEGGGRELVRVKLADAAYPFEATLCFLLYPQRDVIEQWTEIRNGEPGAVVLQRMASSALLLPKQTYLTQFSGVYMREMTRQSTEKITAGLKVLDSKIGVRANQYRNPNFILSFGKPPEENSGEVLAGSLAWSGNFQFTFDGDGSSDRAICGVNPYASAYELKPGETFTTPAMIWVWSGKGLGDMSRKLHAWARDFGIRDGHSIRSVLLNNWEATDFDFDQKRIAGLFPPAREMGVELFLLDDGWFGEKYPRVNSKQGLGDWMPNPRRFPDGLGGLAADAVRNGLEFGVWMEPEMVNQKSALFEKHPDWVIRQPKRGLQEQRSQLVLDLTRPEVQEFVWDSIRGILGVPGITHAKWDCNRYISQPGSPYLAPGKQSHLWIDYVRALYAIMERTAKTFPKTGLMVCAGGGGRVDYGSLRYFDEFWPSDNTDPVARVPMQWDYSYFFPVMATASHVTHMAKRPMHFACAVAMSARFGMDLDLEKLSAEEKAVCVGAISAYKRIREVTQLGDLYRLERPHETDRGALNYVSPDRSRAVVFVFRLKDGQARPVHPQGLDPAGRYKVAELNPAPGRPAMAQEGRTMTGEELMRDGFLPSCSKAMEACVVELSPAGK